jgi:hypothetical protein
MALLAAGLLLGVRWHIVGLLSRGHYRPNAGGTP